MTITELIKELELVKFEYGDLKLYTNTTKEYSTISTEKFPSTLDNTTWKGHVSIIWKNDHN